MIRIEGERTWPQPPAVLHAKLTDLTFLVSCLPDVGSVNSIEENRAQLVLRPGLAFLRGELDLTIERQAIQPPSMAKMLLRTKGIGTTSDVLAAFTLSPHEASGGTAMQWTAEVTALGGLLKAVPSGLIKAAAQKVISDVLASVENKLAAGG